MRPPAIPKKRRSVYPLIEVMGVRSSWETVEMNSFFRRSTSASRLISRSTATMPGAPPKVMIKGAMFTASTLAPASKRTLSSHIDGELPSASNLVRSSEYSACAKSR